MIGAWASRAGISLGQLKVDEKSNEITVISQLPDFLELEGSVITIDAMGTQKEIAEQIIDHGAECVLALKEEVELYFHDA